MAIDISRDLEDIKKLTNATKELKSEYSAITQAQRYDAENTELLTAKKKNLQAQLESIKQTTERYTEIQARLSEELKTSGDTTGKYEKEIAKLEQSKVKLNYTSIALQGQLSTLTGTASATASTMGNLASETNNSTKATDKQTKSISELSKEMRKNKSDWMTWANLVGSAGNMLLGLNNTFKDWNAVNDDGTPKMNASAKAAAILAISMQAVAIISQLAKLGVAGLFIGAGLVAASIWTVTNALNSAKDALGGSNDALGNLGSFNGISASVNNTTTKRSERTVNYNMSINANSNAKGYANNPQVINALSNAINYNLGSKNRRR